ncbi:hypothetical protein [Nitrosomonas marina]|uniref:hypothetical protein n=1 Tax=Nitrosomonas marina TaxID=917 RepID=UPI0015A6D6A8|nr:hypothetical protein [Nitrosomonas marina]
MFKCIGQPAILKEAQGMGIWAQAEYGNGIQTLLFGFGDKIHKYADAPMVLTIF